jgi:hypothetical protein
MISAFLSSTQKLSQRMFATLSAAVSPAKSIDVKFLQSGHAITIMLDRPSALNAINMYVTLLMFCPGFIPNSSSSISLRFTGTSSKVYLQRCGRLRMIPKRMLSLSEVLGEKHFAPVVTSKHFIVQACR